MAIIGTGSLIFSLPHFVTNRSVHLKNSLDHEFESRSSIDLVNYLGKPTFN